MWFLRRNRHVLIPAERVSINPKEIFQIVRGRRIIATMPYLLPKDFKEISRLDFQHYLVKAVLGGLLATPLTNPTAILDVATGTGRWAMEIARMFPHTSVTGFDIVPPPVDDSAAQSYNPGLRPANYSFVQGNFFAGLPFADHTFDLVHMRLVYAATPLAIWQPLINEIVRVTKPGGAIELIEGFILIDAGPATTAIVSLISEASRRRGIDPTYGANIEHVLAQAGARDVIMRTIALPIGKQHGRIGMLGELDTLAVFMAIGASVVASGLITAEEWNALYDQMPAEFAATTTLWPLFHVCGKKPFGDK